MTEFVSGGNLKVLLMKSRVDPLEEERTYTNITSTLTERQLIQIAVDVANGMRHLESKQVGLYDRAVIGGLFNFYYCVQKSLL